jgi:hypothetical protein
MRRKGLLIQLSVVALLLVASPNAAAQVPPQPLTITEGPTISGRALVDRVLTARPGEWAPEEGATATYQWRRCDPSGVVCEDIPGANDPNRRYRIADEDGGHTLRVRLTVTNSTQSAFVDSETTALVPLEPPSNIARPTISGAALAGQVLTASPGEWRGTPPLSHGFEWLRCDEGGDQCKTVVVGGASYTLSEADVGSTIRVIVTATNGADSASERSRPTNRVARAPLVNTAPPTIAGIAAVDQTLTAMPGQWVSSGPIDFLYRWLRCKDDGSGCEPIPGADRATYQVRLLDIGFRLRVRVTAIGDGGAGSQMRDSGLTGIVPAPAGVLPFTQSGGATATTAAAFMRPFPRVRIKGYYTTSGAVVQLLTIKRAKGARVSLRCRGADCPYPRRAWRGRRLVRVRSIEGTYRAGTRLTIRVAHEELIGKYTRIRIRKNSAPKRRDRCLMPDSRQPVRCPTVSSFG